MKLPPLLPMMTRRADRRLAPHGRLLTLDILSANIKRGGG